LAVEDLMGDRRPHHGRDLAHQPGQVGKGTAEATVVGVKDRLALLVAGPLVDEAHHPPGPRGEDIAGDVADVDKRQPAHVDPTDGAPVEVVGVERVAGAPIGVRAHPARAQDPARARLQQRPLQVVDDIGGGLPLGGGHDALLLVGGRHPRAGHGSGVSARPGELRLALQSARTRPWGPDMEDDVTRLPDLASRRMGGSVVDANDEPFAERDHLSRREPPAPPLGARPTRRPPSGTEARCTTAGRPGGAASPATTTRPSASACPGWSVGWSSTPPSSPATTRPRCRSRGPGSRATRPRPSCGRPTGPSWCPAPRSRATPAIRSRSPFPSAAPTCVCPSTPTGGWRGCASTASPSPTPASWPAARSTWPPWP